MKKLLTFLGVCVGAIIIGLGVKADLKAQAASEFRVVAGQRVNEMGQAVAGEWVKDRRGWWYRYADHQYPTNRWMKDNGDWYYFRASGYMANNTWVKNYYVGKSGAMLKNTYTPDGYRVDASGKWVKGTWRSNSKGWWYEYSDGRYPYARWAYIGGRWFYFNHNGYMLSNTWIDYYFYLGSDGAMLTNTVTPDGYRVGADGAWDGSAQDTKVVATSQGRTVADAALAQLGYRQRCNDLASNALRAVGIYWNGAAESFFNIGSVVSASEAVPGDLAFYYDAGGYSTHIAVYIGDGQAVHGGWNGGGTEVYSVYIGTGPIFIRPNY